MSSTNNNFRENPERKNSHQMVEDYIEFPAVTFEDDRNSNQESLVEVFEPNNSNAIAEDDYGSNLHNVLTNQSDDECPNFRPEVRKRFGIKRRSLGRPVLKPIHLKSLGSRRRTKNYNDFCHASVASELRPRI